MTTCAGIAAHHVNTYHCNNGLVFQFILSEFLETFSTILKINAICSSTATQQGSYTSLLNQRGEIVDLLTKLTGTPLGNMRLFCWSSSTGSLSKLRSYCLLLLQNSDSEEKELIALQHYSEKVWFGTSQISEALNIPPYEASTLVAGVEKTTAAMTRFSKLITRLIPQFRDDENVIYFFVRHHKQFDKLYGHRFVIKLLCRLYPRGLQEVQLFLSRKYSIRGFDDLVPAISKHIVEIEAASS